MFFHADNFSQVLDTDQAELIAKMANDVIDKNSTVLYGRKFSNGTAQEFSTTKDRTDTHVTLAVGMETMGSLKPSVATVHLDRPSQEDRVRALESRLRQVERENRQLKEK